WEKRSRSAREVARGCGDCCRCRNRACTASSRSSVTSEVREPRSDPGVIDDHAPGLEEAFCLQAREDSYPVREIEGEIPPFLRGTYYRNGPAQFQWGG